MAIQLKLPGRSTCGRENPVQEAHRPQNLRSLQKSSEMKCHFPFKGKILPSYCPIQALYNPYMVGICLGYSPKGFFKFSPVIHVSIRPGLPGPPEIQVYFSIDLVTFGPRDERSLDRREEEFEPLNAP